MTVKDKESDVFSYFKKSNVNFLLEVILFLCSLNKGLFEHIFEYVDANMCVFKRTQGRGNRLCVLRSLHGLPGQRC